LILVGFSAQRDGGINIAIRLKFPLRAGMIRSPGQPSHDNLSGKILPIQVPRQYAQV
jgi:hypothetical protein